MSKDPNNIQIFKRGLQPSVDDKRNLMFSTYIEENLPVLPSYDNLAKIWEKLNDKPSLTDLYPMNYNDQYGNCAFCAVSHAVTTYKGLVGEKYIPNADEVLKNYLQYNNGQDIGCNLLQLFKTWQKTKWFRDEDIAFVKIDPKNNDHIKQAIALFGGIYLGVNLQQNADADFHTNTTWTPGPLTGDGHAVYLLSYDSETVKILTWGDYVLGSWAWLNYCTTEAWAVVSLETEKISGFKLSDLRKDLIKVGKSGFGVVEDINYITGNTQTII